MAERSAHVAAQGRNGRYAHDRSACGYLPGGVQGQYGPAERILGSTSFEFNSRYDEQSQNWKAEGGTFEIDPITCYANFSSGTLGVDDTFRFYKDDLDELLPRYGGINTVYSPVLELALDFNSSNLKDYYIIWKTQEGGDEWFRVSHNELVTTQKTYFDSYSDRCYL